MTGSPPGPEAGGAADVPMIGGDQRGDRDEVVGVGGVAQAERQRDQQRDHERRAREEALEPGVGPLDGPEEEVEAHLASPPSSPHLPQIPTIGKCPKPTSKPKRERTSARTASSSFGCSARTAPQRSQAMYSRRPSAASA